MAGPVLPQDRGYKTVAAGSAGAALGAFIGGLPILWGQVVLGGAVSGGLALFWMVGVLAALAQYRRGALKLLLAAPMVLAWPAAAAWLLWLR